MLSFANIAMTTKLMHSADISEWMEACAETEAKREECSHAHMPTQPTAATAASSKPATNAARNTRQAQTVVVSGRVAKKRPDQRSAA